MTRSKKSAGHFQKKAAFLQRIVTHLRRELRQALRDYDQIEKELKTLLSVDYSITPNTTLMMMSHEDLAIYADQLRAKCIRLQAGEQHAAQTLS